MRGNRRAATSLPAVETDNDTGAKKIPIKYELDIPPQKGDQTRFLINVGLLHTKGDAKLITLYILQLYKLAVTREMPEKGIYRVIPGSEQTLVILKGAAAKNIVSVLKDPDTGAMIGYYVGVNGVFLNVTGEILEDEDPRANEAPVTYGLYCRICYERETPIVKRLDQRNANGNWTMWCMPAQDRLEELNEQIEAEKRPLYTIDNLPELEVIKVSVCGECGNSIDSDAFKDEVAATKVLADKGDNDARKRHVALLKMRTPMVWVFVPAYDKELGMATEDEVALFEESGRPVKNSKGNLVKRNHAGEIVRVEKLGELSKLANDQARLARAEDGRQARTKAADKGALGGSIEDKIRRSLSNNKAFARMLEQVDAMEANAERAEKKKAAAEAAAAKKKEKAEKKAAEAEKKKAAAEAAAKAKEEAKAEASA